MHTIALPGLNILAGPRRGIAWLATVFTSAGAAIVTNRMIQPDPRWQRGHVPVQLRELV